MKYLFISVGGFLGAVLRYIIEIADIPAKSNFPINTFVINITGSLVLGIVLTIGIERLVKNENIKPLITVGFISSFTTFSTFTLDAVKLIENGLIIRSVQYTLFSLICGLFAVKFGSLIGSSINNYSAARLVPLETQIEELE